jgi:hypothetical protein
VLTSSQYKKSTEKSIHREIVSNFFPSKSNKTMANEIVKVAIDTHAAVRVMEILPYRDIECMINFDPNKSYTLA